MIHMRAWFATIQWRVRLIIVECLKSMFDVVADLLEGNFNRKSAAAVRHVLLLSLLDLNTLFAGGWVGRRGARCSAWHCISGRMARRTKDYGTSRVPERKAPPPSGPQQYQRKERNKAQRYAS